jgi:DNA-binding transcriptional MocR family regulator
MTGGMVYATSETAALLVNSGQAAQIRDMNREEIEARVALVQKIFGGHSFDARPTSPYFWLKLPEPWLSGTYKSAALAEGILVDDEDEFKATRDGRAHHRVRIGISTVRGRADVEAGLETLRRLLDMGAVGYGRSE